MFEMTHAGCHHGDFVFVGGFDHIFVGNRAASLDNGRDASIVDVRGLGAQRTLALLDGRRVSPARGARIFLITGHVTMMISDDSMSTARPVSKPW